MDEREKAAHQLLMEELGAMGVPTTHEKAITYRTLRTSGGRPRWRNVDVVAQVGPEEVWVEIDGPNHKGSRNARRDALLLGLAMERGARLLHWPLWRILDQGISPLIRAIIDGESHFGHASGRYSTYAARHYAKQWSGAR